MDTELLLADLRAEDTVRSMDPHVNYYEQYLLAMGIALTVNFHWGFGTTWVTIAMVGWALSFVTGIAVLSPRAKRLVALMDSVGAAAPETQAAVRELPCTPTRMTRKKRKERKESSIRTPFTIISCLK